MRRSALDDDGQHVAVFQLVIEAHPLVVELRTRSTDTGEAELAHEVPVQLHADVLHRGVVLDDEGLLHVGFLPLRLEEDPHEAEVIIDEIFQVLKPDVLER